MTDLHSSHPETIERLYGILEEEVRQQQAIAEKLAHKSELLASNKPQGLGKLDRELMTLAQKATQLEKQRQAAISELGHAGSTLKNVIPQLPATEVPRFQQVRDRLITTAKATERLNRDNQDLLTLSLQWIQDTVEIIANALTPEAASYNAQGSKVSAQPARKPATIPQSTVSHSA